MTIRYDEHRRIFHLQAAETSYVFQIAGNGQLLHLYWGKRLRDYSSSENRYVPETRAFGTQAPFGDVLASPETVPAECPTFGTGDYRTPMLHAQYADGSTVSSIVYESHQIYRGKPQLQGLPSTYAEKEEEADTLELVLRDSLTGLKAVLLYTAFRDFNAITRSIRLVNEGEQAIQLQKVLSASLDLPHADYDLLHLYGAWARERSVERVRLTAGTKSIESRRGASSHQHNPFIAVMERGAGEDHGQVYSMNLVYSGNFVAETEIDSFCSLRMNIGINPFDFSWLLEAGESFQTPEAVLVHAANGLGEMSRTYHKLYRTRLCRGRYRDAARPVLINNWEATYFDFNADKIEQIAAAAGELGIELFVLDDGWFGQRHNDASSLGDWFVNEKKLPGGLKQLAERVQEKGLQFGLWFEPEMISPDSELYRAHPDWCLHVEGRDRMPSRNQYVLDFSRADVRKEIAKRVKDILQSAPITYVKWDMNRHMSEVGSAALPPQRQRETAHRYMLGLYEMLEEITSAFPDVLFESCSGGGGRFDPGMLYYMPQTWTSDNTDAMSRLYIQYGTSIVYPISSTGAHISAVPNHQLGRTTSLETRGHVAMTGNFGYELDLSTFSEEERALAREQVAAYKRHRELIQFGEHYRLASPFEGNTASWMIVSQDRTEAILLFARILAEPNVSRLRIRLKGLNEQADYRLKSLGSQPVEGVLGGDELMQAGLLLPSLKRDFDSILVHLVQV
ncbi:alpha-galactosidase [Xylanibacillus composti]|uniref:Alpha-galactosidase n=1 Tax=Xylanibacillus composti TaxID=1572762 RepID=A0A8J4M1T1_9BACL|nr:alpha-galactosidase [Xylanibacillus composti]MDT9724931.1 alpha-galactosidase [Xylanibacillus composti]GIQ68167.1 alpha-galactosidase [Xylanibacillus composti]